MQQVIEAALQHVSGVGLGIAGVAIGLAGLVVLYGQLAATRRLARALAEFHDAAEGRADQQREVLEAILRQINGCAIDIAQVKQQIGTYVSTRESQLEERKKILKTIAGHLVNPPQRGA